MKEKEFGSFFQEGHELLRSDARAASHERIIKKNRVLKTARIKKYIPGEFEDRAPEIFLIETDGQMSEIRFKCPCGCEASVEIITTAAPEPERSEETNYEETLMDS